MREFYTGGSLGDTYIIVCKLYSIAKKERILCKHFTLHNTIKPTICEIYSLMPNIAVEFRDNQNHPGITGQFIHHELVGKRITYLPAENIYNLKLECHPEFELGGIKHFGLPENYITLQLESGANPEKRKHISTEDVNKIIKDSMHPAVIIGRDSMDISQIEGNMIDLRRMTSIKESIKIIKESRHFYGCLGLLSLVAVSHRVLSTLYKPNYYKDKHAFESRIQPITKWRRYVEE